MKIISNFKDYYDYLQGKYGIDEKVVYERVCAEMHDKWEKIPLHKPAWIEFPDSETLKKEQRISIAIAGNLIQFYYCKGRFLFGKDGENEMRRIMGYPEVRQKRGWRSRSIEDESAHPLGFKPTNINDKCVSPVVLCSGFRGEGFTRNVRLSDFGIPQIIPAEEMYLMISNFLTKGKPVNDNRTDVQKIVGHGFDKKYSFRHPIK